MNFAKYHALGNDYLVVTPEEIGGPLTVRQVQLLCDRHYGPGSDGLLLGPAPDTDADFSLRFFNPDGGEFEKSGNGLRIFARYLWDQGLVGEEPFSLMTPGGRVTAQVHEDGRRVVIEMGAVSFDSSRIPVRGPIREVLDEEMEIGDQVVRYSAATIGNPHCVVHCGVVNETLARGFGPRIECEPRFPHRTNVQFMRVLDRSRIQIEIWERGVGYTLASGSSSCAAAGVAHRLGLCDDVLSVEMPGGVIDIRISPDWTVSMSGGVTRVCEGRVFPEMFELAE